MNLSEINWDFNEAGSWPLPVKIGAVLGLCLLVAGAGVYYDTLGQLEELESSEKTEVELKQSFEVKQKKAVNLQDYKDQLQQIEALLGEMIKQMPTRQEVANLLVDISQTGLVSGLEFRLFRPESPVRREFYAELPISIQVTGKYEALGLFVSGLASLPRIVTVGNVKISPIAKSDDMVMDATVKTYNEASDEDGASSASKNKRRGGK
ncbi:MAG: pilus assembly protein PilO [Gammaproteobacteria bacterium HGW-Gammaproteobacteria-3]|nr:MAG: pilus assembly protein PilO [Gammaproteobacteria bacterium HGW-Gammaproteobacteria-3]